MNLFINATLVLVVVGADAPRNNPVSTETVSEWTQVQGLWDIVRYKAGGLGWSVPDGEDHALAHVRIQNNKIIVKYANGTFIPFRGQMVGFDDRNRIYRVDLHIEEEGQEELRRGIACVADGIIKCRFSSINDQRPNRLEEFVGDDNSDFFILRRNKTKP